MHYERGISTQIAEHSDVRVEAREVGLGGSVSRQIGEWVRPYSCGRVDVQAHMRRLLKEDRARHHEAAARQEAGSAEREEPTYRLSQRRQRKRQGRVTDAPAHMPETLSKNSV